MSNCVHTGRQCSRCGNLMPKPFVQAIDFFVPPRDDFLLGGKPAYMSEG